MSAGLRWSHAALNCADQKATEEFYHRWFGFERARTVDLGDQQIVFLKQGQVYLELFAAGAGEPLDVTKDGPSTAGTVRHLAFQTEDLTEFLSGLDEDVPVSLGPLSFDDFIPGWRSIWLTDPDGVVVEVSEGYRDDPSAHAHAHTHAH
ncbi:VOC family protein [Kitasatospora sp. NPDC051853]|uniref:VOC family protein n=1 Tax=Kitasatospora sp. NPDC051853 TaxID=3364058 RepID=UPI0037ABFB75